MESVNYRILWNLCGIFMLDKSHSVYYYSSSRAQGIMSKCCYRGDKTSEKRNANRNVRSYKELNYVSTDDNAI
jgi:hypothetical protein